MLYALCSAQQMGRYGNTLLVHVISARGIIVKGPTDVYASISLTGASSWKSKVCTNYVHVDVDAASGESVATWDEHCEFNLSDSDARFVVHVNRKTALGTTETLGEMVLQISSMVRYQAAAFFKLHSKSGKERGLIQLQYQFASSGNSQPVIEQTSLGAATAVSENQQTFTDRDSKKLSSKLFTAKARVPFLGRGLSTDAAADDYRRSWSAKSSRRSSFSSNASSAIEFNSASPIIFPGSVGETGPPINCVNATTPYFTGTKPEILIVNATPSSHSSPPLPQKFSVLPKLDENPPSILTHVDSVDSSGIASSSAAGTLTTLNEHTSPEYLLNVITHLRKELMLKETRIRDLEGYIDRLVNKVMQVSPELLQCPSVNKPAFASHNNHRGASRPGPGDSSKISSLAMTPKPAVMSARKH